MSWLKWTNNFIKETLSKKSLTCLCHGQLLWSANKKAQSITSSWRTRGQKGICEAGKHLPQVHPICVSGWTSIKETAEEKELCTFIICHTMEIIENLSGTCYHFGEAFNIISSCWFPLHCIMHPNLLNIFNILHFNLSAYS